jgi:hypothetical protein
MIKLEKLFNLRLTINFHGKAQATLVFNSFLVFLCLFCNDDLVPSLEMLFYTEAHSLLFILLSKNTIQELNPESVRYLETGRRANNFIFCVA